MNTNILLYKEPVNGQLKLPRLIKQSDSIQINSINSRYEFPRQLHKVLLIANAAVDCRSTKQIFILIVQSSKEKSRAKVLSHAFLKKALADSFCSNTQWLHHFNQEPPKRSYHQIFFLFKSYLTILQNFNRL